jgi:membrane protease YdiL (CAAX protease family)
MSGARRPWSLERQLGTFVVLAFVLSWAWWVPMAVRGDVVHAGRGWPTHLVGLAGPGVAAVITAAWCGGWREATVLLRRCLVWRVPLVAWLALAGAVALALLAAILAERPTESLSYSGAPRLGIWTVLFVLLLNGFGEELGWRGFLVTRLRTTRSLRDTSVIVWLVWGCWHLPLFWIVANFRDFGVAGTIGWVVGLFFGSVFLAWLVGAADGSVLVVALWHTGYNFATATEAAAGVVAAVATMAVVLATVWIMRTSTEVPEASAPGSLPQAVADDRGAAGGGACGRRHGAG